MGGAELQHLLSSLGAGDDAYRTPYYASIAAFFHDNHRLRPGARVAEFGAASNGVIRGILAHASPIDYSHLRYPIYDLLNLANVRPRQYDAVILEQIVEHLPDPFRAAHQVRRILRPGGFAIVATVFLYPMHYVDRQDKQDYFRFTPLGLRAVFSEYQVHVARAYGSLPFVRYLAANGWFEQGRSGGYTSNTLGRASAAGVVVGDDEDFGVTTLLIAARRQTRLQQLLGRLPSAARSRPALSPARR